MPLNSSKNMAFTRQLLADQILRPTQKFFRKQVASSVLLLAATIIALVWANSNIAETYHSFWHTEISFAFGELRISKTLLHWINDGLMALFFLSLGWRSNARF